MSQVRPEHPRGMTDTERFEFDLNGYLVRPCIIDRPTVEAIRRQLHAIKHEPESLPPEERAVPGGPSSVLIDHPRVTDVIHEVGPHPHTHQAAAGVGGMCGWGGGADPG